MLDLIEQECKTITQKEKPLVIPTIESYLSSLDGWNAPISPISYAYIEKKFSFKNYYKTVAFVNAVTWISHQQDHHPEIYFSYNECKIILKTHIIKGLSLNDFIMAAKINELLKSG